VLSKVHNKLLVLPAITFINNILFCYCSHFDMDTIILARQAETRKRG